MYANLVYIYEEYTSFREIKCDVAIYYREIVIGLVQFLVERRVLAQSSLTKD